MISDFDDEAITELFNEHFPRDIANNDFNSLLSTMDIVNEMKERFPKPHVDFMQHIIDIIQWVRFFQIKLLSLSICFVLQLSFWI